MLRIKGSAKREAQLRGGKDAVIASMFKIWIQNNAFSHDEKVVEKKNLGIEEIKPKNQR